MAASPLRRLLVLWIAFTGPSLGQTQSVQSSPTTASKASTAQQPATSGSLPGRASNETGPSLELLEFLGEFETADGQWHDPLEDLENSATPSQPTGPIK